jgi:hypothetical protein
MTLSEHFIEYTPQLGLNAVCRLLAQETLALARWIQSKEDNEEQTGV